MDLIEASELVNVSGGLVQLPSADGEYRPVNPYALEVGATGQGDDLHYTGSSGGGGVPAGQCAALGSLAGIATGLIVGGVCTAVVGSATGGLGVPACAVAGSVSGAVVSGIVSSDCNRRSGR